MDRLVKFLATAGGLGYLPAAPGTAGSALGLLIGLAVSGGLAHAVPLQAALLTAAIGAAVAVSTAAERLFNRHDPSCIVIDEVVGMWLTLALAPPLGPAGWLLAFALFRLFDIVKPPPLRWLATRPGGWGIVLDDLGAALYTGLVMWLIGLVHSP